MKKLNQKKWFNGAGSTGAPAPSHFDPLKCLALYSGQDLLGHLRLSSCGVEAFLNGKSIGIFSNQKLAAAALTRASS